MIAEALNPPIPAPDGIPVQPNEGNSDADVKARFNEAMKPKADVQDISTARNPLEQQVKPKEEKKEVKGKVDDIPDEFFGETKTEDEWDRVMKEEVKGHTTNQNFKNVKELAAKKMAEKDARIAELEGKIPKDDFVPEKTAKQLEALQKKLEEREELINRKYVEESPEFRERFSAKKESIVNRFNKAAKGFELSDRVVKSLLSADSVKDRSDILEESGLGAAGISSLTAILDQYDSVESERADFLSDWKTRAGELEESHRAQEDKEKARIKGLYDKAFDDVLKSMEDHPLLKKRGKEDFDRQTTELIDEAKKYFNAENSTPHKDAEMFLAGVLARRATAMMEKAQTLYRETKKELDELKAAGPGGGHGSETSKDDPTKHMSPDERASHTFRSFQATAANGYVG